MEPIDKVYDREVVGVRAKLTRTGDGLSKSMKLAPMVLHHGDEVMVLCKATVTHVDTIPHTKDDLHGPLDFVYVLEASTMMLTDTVANERALARQYRKIQESTEIEGQLSIGDEEAGEDDEEDDASE